MPADPHEFVFEIDVAIRTQVIQKLEASPQLKLIRDVAHPLKGVYALYWRSKLVYAGEGVANHVTETAERALRQDCGTAEHPRSRHSMPVSHGPKRLVRQSGRGRIDNQLHADMERQRIRQSRSGTWATRGAR
jgi:hypothetical protein